MLDHQPRRLADLLLGHEDEVVEVLPEDPLRQLERHPRREPLGVRLHLTREQLARLPGAEGCGRRLRLDADDLDVGSNPLGDDARSGRAAAAPDRDQDHVHLGQLLEQLERLGADAGDQVRLVPGVDVAVPVLARERLAVLTRLVEVPAVDDQLGAERRHRVQLHRVRVLRDADAGGDAEQPRRVGDGLPVVPRRRRDQAPPALVLRELRHEVHAAAHLERPDGLVVLVLHPHVRVQQPVEPGVREERRRTQVRPDPLGRVADVVDRQLRPLHAPSLAP
ncbi:MAG TPA: hypothetical protein VIA10_09840 [Gaiellaceae bacterium]